MQIAAKDPQNHALATLNPFSVENKAVIAEQMTYLEHMFKQLSQDAMACKSAATKTELLKVAMQAQKNYVKTYRLLLEIKKEGEKPAVYTLESDPYS